MSPCTLESTLAPHWVGPTQPRALSISSTGVLGVWSGDIQKSEVPFLRNCRLFSEPYEGYTVAAVGLWGCKEKVATERETDL